MGQSSKPSSKPQKAGKTPKNGKTPQQKAQTNSSFSSCVVFLSIASSLLFYFVGTNKNLIDAGLKVSGRA
jgi:hypothetical protein